MSARRKNNGGGTELPGLREAPPAVGSAESATATGMVSAAGRKSDVSDRSDAPASPRAVPPGYKMTEVGVIPVEWDVCRLGRLVSSVEYGSAAKSNPQGHTPVLRMGNLLGQANINGQKLKTYPIPLPPTLAEQRAIASAVSDVDALLGKMELLLAKKRDLKQAAMQRLLTGQQRLPGFEGTWEAKRLGEVAERGSGGTPPSSVPAYYGGDIPWVSISDMTNGGKVIFSTDRYLTHAGFTNSAAQMFPVGTVLYAMYASLGECSIAGISLCTSQAILGIRPKATLNMEFLYYYLTSLKTTVKSMGQQGTQANLNKGMVQAFTFSLPPLPEQTAIAAVLSDLDAEIAALAARRDKTRALKQGMMQELLTGRVRLV